MAVARQALLSMGFSGREHWSGLPFPFLGDLPNLEIESGSPALQADCLPCKPPGIGFSLFLLGITGGWESITVLIK